MGAREGKTYEALVKVALDELVRKGKLSGAVYWNQQPSAMTIEPDLTVGRNKDAPSHVFLVTHSGAAGNSHMKFWRNIGELAEAKIRLRAPPKVYSVVFDSVIKEDLKALQRSAFDGQVLVGDEEYGQELQAWVNSETPNLPKDGEAKSAAIADAYRTGPKTTGIRPLLDDLIRDMARALGASRTELDGLWAMERSRPRAPAPAARRTFVRRGTAKLLVLPDDVRAQVLGGQRKFEEREDLLPALRLGILSKAVSTPGKPPKLRLCDEETVSALSLLGEEALRCIFATRLSDGVRSVVEQVRSVSRLDAMLAGLVDNYERLCRPKELLVALEKQYKDPCHLFRGGRGQTPPSDVWLFRLICDAVKALGGAKQGYGYAQLVKDIKAQARAGVSVRFVREVTEDPRWTLPKSGEPVRRGLQDYVNRAEGTSFSRGLLAVVAYALAEKLKTLPKPELRDSVEAIAETWVSSAFEARLLTHRGFDPVGMLIKSALKRIPCREEYIVACFAEAAGTVASRLSGTTKVLVAKTTIVNWQSAHGSHTKDKKKELCGRAIALRYAWDANKQAYVARPGIRKLLLVVDGDWQQPDLDALVSSGWDEVFYPDELDRLSCAIE